MKPITLGAAATLLAPIASAIPHSPDLAPRFAFDGYDRPDDPKCGCTFNNDDAGAWNDWTYSGQTDGAYPSDALFEIISNVRAQERVLPNSQSASPQSVSAVKKGTMSVRFNGSPTDEQWTCLYNTVNYLQKPKKYPDDSYLWTVVDCPGNLALRIGP